MALIASTLVTQLDAHGDDCEQLGHVLGGHLSPGAVTPHGSSAIWDKVGEGASGPRPYDQDQDQVDQDQIAAGRDNRMPREKKELEVKSSELVVYDTVRERKLRNQPAHHQECTSEALRSPLTTLAQLFCQERTEVGATLVKQWENSC